MPALGFFGIGPRFTGDDVVFLEARANERDDKIDALTKGFLGLTVTCARCHNHKYDPISQKDYYALSGVFADSGFWEYNLPPEKEVEAYQAQRKKVKAAENALQEYAEASAIRVAETLASQIPEYMMAVRKTVLSNPKGEMDKVAAPEKLDAETFQRWFKYLTTGEKLHPYLKVWDVLMAKGGGTDGEARKIAEGFRDLVLKVIPEKKAVLAANQNMMRDYKPDPNEATAMLPGDLVQFELFQFKQLMVQKVMDTNHFYVWLDVVQGEDDQSYVKKDGILEYKGKNLLRFLTPKEKGKLDALQAEVTALTKAMNKFVSASTRLRAVIVSGILFHTQLAFAAGCDLPMFAGARLFPSVSGSQMLATGDFNHDGFLDLAVANGPGGIISILLGNGDGTFLPVNYAAGGFASCPWN